MDVPFFWEKNSQGIAKGTVIRWKNSLLSLIQGGDVDSVWLNHRNYLVESYSKLEKAQGNYLVAAQIDIKDSQEEAKYLDQPLQEMA